MKKFTIIFINILIILILYFIFEYIIYKNYFIERYDIVRPFIKERKINNLFVLERFDKEELYNNEFKKSPVLLLGCSYTRGGWIPEETYAKKLSRLTKRPVYNWGRAGAGPEFVLGLIEEEEQNHILKNYQPEIIIYTYMFNHIHRLGYWDYYDILRKNGIMDYKGPKFLYNSYIYSYIRNTQFSKEYVEKKTYELQMKIFKCLVQKCKKLFPQSKFVFLLYYDINYDLSEGFTGSNGKNQKMIDEEFEVLYSDKFKQDLENLGTTVITTEELIGRKMDREEDRVPKTIDKNSYPHPSEKAWDEILPKLVKKLNL